MIVHERGLAPINCAVYHLNIPNISSAAHPRFDSKSFGTVPDREIRDMHIGDTATHLAAYTNGGTIRRTEDAVTNCDICRRSVVSVTELIPTTFDCNGIVASCGGIVSQLCYTLRLTIRDAHGTSIVCILATLLILALTHHTPYMRRGKV